MEFRTFDNEIVDAGRGGLVFLVEEGYEIPRAANSITALTERQ